MEKAGRNGKDRGGVAGTEGGRRPTGVPATPPPQAGPGGPHDPPDTEPRQAVQAPDPEVLERPVRRSFTAEYKRRIVEEADRCTPGELGTLLRREGLYSSHLSTWRRQRDQALLTGLGAKKRGRKPRGKAPLVEENERLRRENARLQAHLKQAQVVIEVQKKISELLGIPLDAPERSASD